MIYSRAAITCGLLSLSFMCLSLFGGSWLHCQERTVLYNRAITDASFRIGLWKVCPINQPTNSSDNYFFRSTDCLYIGYKTWGTGAFSKLDIWFTLQFTPQFVSRMRIATPFGCIGICLIAAATICALIGHFRLNNSMIFACGLFIFGGILIGSGLLVFASILSETYYEAISADNITNVKYNYGLSFFFAAASLAMAKMAVIFSISSYVYKFGTVEEMVRAMVPGADRRFREHYSNERLIRASEIVIPSGIYANVETDEADICETELNSSPMATIIIPIRRGSLNASRFKTLSGREPRYAAPPCLPAQFSSLPWRDDQQKQTTFCTKSAV